MRRLSAKLGLFTCVWYELMVEFGLGAGTAFILTLLLTFLSSAALQMIRLAMHLAGPGAVSIILQAFVWYILFWWMAPPPLWNLPLIADAALFVGLGLIGARWRQNREMAQARSPREPRKDRSLAIVLLVIAGMAAGVLSLQLWGSLWPLVGYALLPLIPLRAGWQFAPPVPPERADARMGERSAFEEAGWSAER